MKTLLATLALLAGCSPLGAIPDSTVDAIASAGGGCVTVTGLWGSAVVMVGSTDKGVIRNGEVTVGANCGGIAIKEMRPAPKP